MSLYCLVHSSGQNAEGWKLLIPELEQRGHRTLAMNLPTDTPDASATHYADVILQALDEAHYPDENTVVVAHSASGMFLPLVAARRRIRHMVFLAALVPKLGTSILEQLKKDPSMLNPDWIGKNPMDDAVAEEFVFHDCTPEVLRWALTTRSIMYARQAMAEVCPLQQWPEVPSSYIVCAEDRTISPDWSRRVAREYLGVEAIELPGGHCPNVSRPAALADVLTRISF